MLLIRPLSRTARSAVALLLCAIAAAAHAGPPFVTDDPEPADYLTWEVNYALTATHASGTTSGFAPSIDANYGAAAGVQLHVQPQLAFSSGDGTRNIGIGDTELGVKWRLTAESDDPAAWMISLYPILVAPSGNASRNLGAGSTNLYLPLWFQTTRGGWTTFGGGGYWIDSGSGNRNGWAGGWAALYQIDPALQLGGELFAKGAVVSGERSSAGFNLGGVLALAHDIKLLFSAGRGLQNVTSTNQASLYLGVQVIY